MKNYFKCEILVIPFSKISAIHIQRGEDFIHPAPGEHVGQYVLNEKIIDVIVFVDTNRFSIPASYREVFLNQYECYLNMVR